MVSSPLHGRGVKHRGAHDQLTVFSPTWFVTRVTAGFVNTEMQSEPGDGKSTPVVRVCMPPALPIRRVAEETRSSAAPMPPSNVPRRAICSVPSGFRTTARTLVPELEADWGVIDGIPRRAVAEDGRRADGPVRHIRDHVGERHGLHRDRLPLRAGARTVHALRSDAAGGSRARARVNPTTRETEQPGRGQQQNAHESPCRGRHPTMREVSRRDRRVDIRFAGARGETSPATRPSSDERRHVRFGGDGERLGRFPCGGLLDSVAAVK